MFCSNYLMSYFCFRYTVRYMYFDILNPCSGGLLVNILPAGALAAHAARAPAGMTLTSQISAICWILIRISMNFHNWSQKNHSCMPHKHAVMCQYRACTEPMLPVQARYWQLMACLQGGLDTEMRNACSVQSNGNDYIFFRGDRKNGNHLLTA